MKGRLVAVVGVFCIAILVVSMAYADKPTDKGKPDKPPGKDKPECIIFVGDLESAGSTEIVGCCPNAGPWPAYEMTLKLGTDGSAHATLFPLATYWGYVFMNGYGRNAPYEGYKVQFWTWDAFDDDPSTPGAGDYFFEIRGGDVQKVKDKQHGYTTVTFNSDPATVWVYYDVNPTLEPCVPDYCVGVAPACDPCNEEDNCRHPCWEEFNIEDVSFVLVRTADLTYSSLVDLNGDVFEVSCPEAY